MAVSRFSESNLELIGGIFENNYTRKKFNSIKHYNIYEIEYVS